MTQTAYVKYTKTLINDAKQYTARIAFSFY